jgi:hypothetical protein
MKPAKAARAREMAGRALAYRAWYVAPGEAPVPPIAVVTDARLQRREQLRQLRRAQVGLFDTPAPSMRTAA